VTAMLYPKLAAKYGNRVTYDEDPTAHIRVEFGFDVVQVAKGRFQEDDYRNFIGFNVDKPLLERAFQDTYGVPLKAVLTKEDGNINSYRYDVSTLIPKMTRVAWASYGKDIQKEVPNATERKFRYRMSRVEYEKAYGSGYQKPSFGDKFVAFLVRLLPKVGPLKALAVKMPNSAEQDIYLKSLNSTVDEYRALLKQVSGAGMQFENLQFKELNLDTGKPTQEGEYQLSDETYAQLLLQITQPNATAPAAEIRDGILGYYANAGNKDFVQAKHPEEWLKVEAALAQLKQEQPAATTPSISGN